MSITSESFYEHRFWPGQNSGRRYAVQVTRNKQPRPWNQLKPLPYSRQGVVDLSFENAGKISDRSWPTIDTDGFNVHMLHSFRTSPAAGTRASNKAYARLKDKLISDESQLGASVAEWRSSGRMISYRAGQLYSSYRHLRRGNFRGFLNTLNVRPKRKHRNTRWTRPRDASSLWLEYWFGWSPLIMDINDSLEVLESDLAPLTQFATATERDSWTSLVGSLEGGNGTLRFWDAKFTVRQGAACIINCPNTALRARLGLTNPASIVWELVPFSFVVDWFGNLGSVLHSINDYAGCELKGAYTTRYYRGTHTAIYTHPYYEGSVKYSGYWLTRSLGLTKPVFQWTLPLRLSTTRGATAISLLVQLFTKG